MKLFKSSREAIPGKPRPRRRWWQVLLRVGIISALVLGVLYVLLPWLLPAEAIRQKLQADLQQQLGVKVTVGPMHFHWDEGVVIDGLTIDDPPGFDGDVMVKVGRICCDFSPLRFCLQKRISWMDVENLIVNVDDNAAGRLNTECLSKLKLQIDTQRLRVRQSELSVFLHDQPRPLVARISDMQVLRSRDTLGQMTMTGSFEQAGTPAPISLRISVDEEDEHAATVDCRFSALDLEQLPRSRSVWGNLPIESMRGRCGGELVFAVGKNLRVEEFRLELLAENLEVKPTGAGPLPVIDQAGLRLEAELDAMSERADVKQFQLRLPGVDLAGTGVLYADLLNGNWEALDDVNLEGTVYPDRVAMLMTGRETLPNSLAIRGPITLHATAQQQNNALGVDLRIDASETSIHADSQLCKPEHQPLRFEIQASASNDDGLCPMDIEQAQLVVGGNTITAAGHIADVAAFVPDPVQSKADQLDAILDACRGVQLHGDVHLNEPMVLTQPWMDKQAEFRGAWYGPWSFTAGETPKFRLALRGGAEMDAAPSNTKPDKKELSLELSAVLDPANRNITNILLDVLTDKGRCSLENTSLRLPTENTSLLCRGDFEIDKLEAFRAWIPGDPKQEESFSGGVKGSFQSKIISTPDSRALATMKIQANLDDLAVTFGDSFVKPAGQKASLDVSARDFYNANAWDATAAFALDGCVFQVDSKGDSDKLMTAVFAEIKNLETLSTQSPALRRWLAGGTLAGPLRIEGAIRREGPQLTYDVKAMSEQLICVIDGDGNPPPLVNMLRQPVSLVCKGSLKEESPGVLNLDAAETSLRLADSSLAVKELRATFHKDRFQDSLKHAKPLDGLDSASVKWNVVCQTNDLLGGMFPRWTGWLDGDSFEGALQASGTMQVDGEGLTAELRADAGDLGMQDGKGFAKPRNVPLAMQLHVTAPRDTAQPLTCDVSVTSAAGDATAQLRSQTTRNEADQPTGIALLDASVTAELKDAAALASYYPALQEHNLAGRAAVKLCWIAGQDRLGTIRELKFDASQLLGDYRGKMCRLSGKVLVKDIDLDDGKTLSVKRVFTDNLEFAAGENHGWLLADVKLASNAPSGTFDLLFESLDDKDLSDWLSEPKAAASPAPATSQPASQADADVALQHRAEDVIHQMHSLFQNADLTGHVKARRYRTYDANVGQHYPTRDMELTLLLKDSRIKVDYRAGLYGGMVVGLVETDLTLPQPIVTSHSEYMDVKATETIQPQIARMFPGNTVTGQFSRTEDVHYPLRDLICNAMDKGYRLCPEGSAIMVATDGVVIGKAAPAFVTKLFPGLNLTKYPYDTMTAFTKFLPDGSNENETFFYGGYDVYMEGVTKRDYTIQYTVGLVLLGSAFPAEALRDWKQGRIPILKVKGRIDDGKLVDDTVSYPLPNESLFEIFVKNNLVYRAWVNLKDKPTAGGQ